MHVRSISRSLYRVDAQIYAVASALDILAEKSVEFGALILLARNT